MHGLFMISLWFWHCNPALQFTHHCQYLQLLSIKWCLHRQENITCCRCRQR